MAKLTVLALALAALVALATAHTTIVTTTIEDENPISEQRQCRQQLQGQRLNQCRMFIQQGQSPYDLAENPQRGQQQQQQQQILQQCCQQLQNIDEQCQCEAVKQVFREAQQQQQQGRQQFGSQQTQRLRQKAQILPNVCNLQSRRCQIGSNFDIPFFDWPFGTGSQQCRESEIQRPVNQCQRYVEQQMQSGRQYQQQSPYQQRRGQQQQQPELQQCCNELQNIKRECQCRAIEEVGRRVMRQQPQQQRRQGGRYGEQPLDIARRVIQDMPNQCDIDVQQCNIPYAMF